MIQHQPAYPGLPGQLDRLTGRRVAPPPPGRPVLLPPHGIVDHQLRTSHEADQTRPPAGRIKVVGITQLIVRDEDERLA